MKRWKSREGHKHIAAAPCEDCNRMIYWCEELEDYFHYARSVTCGLILDPHPEAPRKRRKKK